MTEDPNDIEGEGTPQTEATSEESVEDGVQGAPHLDPISYDRRKFLQRIGGIGAGLLGIGLLGRLVCSKKEEEIQPDNRWRQAPQPQRQQVPPRQAQRQQAQPHQAQQHQEYIQESPLFEVNIDKLRQNIIQNGVLVLTHNGIHENGQVGNGENEFRRIVEKQEGCDSLGKNIKVWQRVVKKECSPKIIDDAGQLQDTEPVVTVYVVDGTQGVQNAMTPEELKRTFQGKKFGLILVAGHVFDIEKLIELSKAVRADESYTLMGGCRTSQFIRNHYAPKHIFGGSVYGIGTEAYTHFMRVTIGALLGKQFKSWTEYFNVMRRYSTFTNDHILPGHPYYGSYLQQQPNY